MTRSSSAFRLPLGELAAVAAIAAAGLALAQRDATLVQSLVANALILCFLALGIGVLIRLSGLVSFGHAAPFGLGAYGVAFAFSKAAPVPPELVLLLIAPAAGLVFFLIGLVVSRLEGIAFSMLTLALGQAAFIAATKFRGLTGGADGVMVALPRRLFGFSTDALQQPNGMLVAALFALLAVYLALRLFERSPAGRLAVAIRENEERARFLGYRTRALKAAVFGLSAAVASVGGVAFGLYQGFVSPEILTWGFSGSGLIMAILGGTSALWGPIVGAAAFFFAREWLTELTTHWLAILGATLIVVMVAWPKGLSGAVVGWRARRRAAAAPAAPAAEAETRRAVA